MKYCETVGLKGNWVVLIMVYRVFRGNPDHIQDVVPWVKTKTSPKREVGKFFILEIQYSEKSKLFIVSRVLEAVYGLWSVLFIDLSGVKPIANLKG